MRTLSILALAAFVSPIQDALAQQPQRRGMGRFRAPQRAQAEVDTQSDHEALLKAIRQIVREEVRAALEESETTNRRRIGPRADRRRLGARTLWAPSLERSTLEWLLQSQAQGDAQPSLDRRGRWLFEAHPEHSAQGEHEGHGEHGGSTEVGIKVEPLKIEVREVEAREVEASGVEVPEVEITFGKLQTDGTVVESNEVTEVADTPQLRWVQLDDVTNQKPTDSDNAPIASEELKRLQETRARLQGIRTQLDRLDAGRDVRSSPKPSTRQELEDMRQSLSDLRDALRRFEKSSNRPTEATPEANSPATPSPKSRPTRVRLLR